MPKQFQSFGGKPVLRHTLEAFGRDSAISTTRVVIAQGQEDSYREAATGLDLAPAVTGGATRQESGHRGLEALAAEPPRNVLIHDAARPFVSQELVSRVIAGLDRHAGVVPALPVADTLKRAPAGIIEGTVDRGGLWSAQTPQGFRYDLIRSAHARAAGAGLTDFTDDAAVAEWAGMKVAVVPGEPANRKLTTVDDIREASRRFMEDSFDRCPEVRTGQGFDVHPFAAGDSVILCGVTIPHHARLRGHSDADAPMHALTDAILATICEGDIGQHFPSSDARWKDAASSIFLAHAAGLLRERGGFIANVDITIVCETPRIAPHVGPMRSAVAAILSVTEDRVSIKATTSETLGFTGRGEGLAALATATVRLPAT
jgi:2-C-methyl-D-erythritol 4-phosphate cytidylyltransferase/2-C-methyl-D-erythritol 2,4-cyclodiphosphate synthase